MAGRGGHSRDEPSGGVRPGALSALLQEIAAAPAAAGDTWDSGLRSGAVVGRFELAREIGRGGFGVVWEAKDRELGRRVAFKAVRSGSRRELAEERLLLEAEAAARLSHPNIVTLHDVGRSEHGPYLVLELLQGKTLSERLSHGALQVRDAVGIAAEIAKGLAHAHAHGVIHRDLKPANVFLCDDGRVKVLDFGLAHAFGRRRVDGGTPAYMAPEQLEGAPEDERSDVFALGVILFEMLSGTLPFGDEKALRSSSPAPGLEIPGIPPLGTFVSRMLQKLPVDRPRDGSQLLGALSSLASELERAPAAGPVRTRTSGLVRWGPLVVAIAIGAAIAPTAVRRMASEKPVSSNERILVAVADFANETGEKELDALSGLLITSLEQSRRIAVLTRSRAIELARQGGHEKVAQIDEVVGRSVVQKAGARALLVATVHRLGSVYAVELRAVDPRADRYLFTLREQTSSRDRILDLIDRIAERARAELRETPAEVAASTVKVGAAVTGSLDAYRHYFAGQELLARGEYSAAAHLFRQAVEADPMFAMAHLELAFIVEHTLGDRAEADAHLQRALAHVDRIPEKSRKLVLLWKARREGSTEEALRQANDLVAAHPDDGEVLRRAGTVLRSMGGPLRPRGRELLRGALALDLADAAAAASLVRDLVAEARCDEAMALARPLTTAPGPAPLVSLALAQACGGQKDQALASARRAAALASQASVETQDMLAGLLVHAGHLDEAEALLRAATHIRADPAIRRSLLPKYVITLALEGRRREALRVWDESRSAYGKDLPDFWKWARAFSLGSGQGPEGRRRAWEWVDRNIDPGPPGAATYEEVGFPDRARELAQRLDAGSPFLRLYRAQVARREGRSEDALRLFNEFLADPTMVDFHPSHIVLTGELLLDAGRPAEALEQLRDVERSGLLAWVQSAQAYPRALLVRARSMARLGRSAEALREIDRLLDLWKKADPDLPLLVEAKTMRIRVAAASGAVKPVAAPTP